jgi:phosphatidylethanolamine-binding protein (PEBP) family uncharacterized protein
MKLSALFAVAVLAACSSTSATPSSPVDAGVTADGSAEGGGTTPDSGPFVLTSTAFSDKGTLPAEYTCDGVGHSPPLAWTGAPAGTTEYAVLMTTLAKDGLKWNWVLWGVPGNVGALAVGQTGVGTAGLTSDGPNLAYSPPCSQGPGAKDYTFTVYALSGKPTLPAQASQVTGDVLTAAIKPLTLASSAITVSYTRPPDAGAPGH